MLVLSIVKVYLNYVMKLRHGVDSQQVTALEHHSVTFLQDIKRLESMFHFQER